MSLQRYLRLALVGLTLSVVGCLPDVSKGDVTDDAQIKIQALESFKSVNSPIQNPTRGSFPRNIEQLNGKPWIRSASDNQRHEVNAKNPSFSPTDTRASADAIYSVLNKVQSNSMSRNIPVEFSSAKFNEETDAKKNYAFPTVQRERNPLDLKERQMSSSDVNLAPRLVRKKGGSNVHKSGSFGYQPKSEMLSDSSRSLGLNEPYLRENFPTNYMSRSSTVNHNIRHKSDGNMQRDNFLQNNGQNQNVLRRVIPANTSPSVLTTNEHGREPLPQAFSAGTGFVSQISYENMKNVALSKVLKPPTILTPVSPAFKRSDSNAGRNILPIIKSKMFSSQLDVIKPSNSERVSNPTQVFEYGNTKSATSSHALRNIQLTQNGYQNRGESSQNVVSIETFHDQKKYDNLATGISAIRPPVTNNARFYFQSDENRGIRLSKQNTDLPPRMQFTKNEMLFSERDKNVNLPDLTNHSLMKQSQHNTKNRTHLNSFGQSTVQSLSVKHYLAPSLVSGNTMKNHIHSISPTVYATQSTNVGTSSSRNRPYYLTSKKPYAFKSFTFVPALQTSQKSEMHSDQKPLLESSSNAQYALAHPHTAQSALAQTPLTRESYEKTLFQEKPPYWDQTDSFKNEPQRETISSAEGVSNLMSDALKHPVRGQAVTMKAYLFGTSATNKVAVDEVQSKTSQRWTSNRLASVQPTESNPDEFPKVRFSNGSFVGSNLNKASIKSSNSHNSPTSELVLPIYKSSLMNKVTGYAKIHNAVIQPLHRYSLKGHENSIPQSNTGQKYSPVSLRPTSSVVIGRQVEDHSDHQNVNAISTSQSPIYRSADVNRYKTDKSAKLTFQSPIYTSPRKPSGKANILQANAGSDWRKETSQISEADINLNAAGVSQALRPTSSFVVGKYINTLDKTSTKANLNKYSAKPDYKPLQFLDIAGSASFTDVKLYSAGTTAKEEVDLKSVQNGTNSTSVMEESLKKLVFDSSSMTSALQNESTVDLRVSELMPRAAIDFTTQSQPEELTPPQPTVYTFESQQDPGNNTSPTAEDIDPFYEGTLVPNTTLQDKMTSG